MKTTSQRRNKVKKYQKSKKIINNNITFEDYDKFKISAKSNKHQEASEAG